ASSQSRKDGSRPKRRTSSSSPAGLHTASARPRSSSSSRSRTASCRRSWVSSANRGAPRHEHRAMRTDVTIVGGGIGGLTLALEQAGIAARVFESAPDIRPLGVGINVLPHGTKELFRLGLASELERVAVETREAVFFNRFGQLIYREPLGRAAGYRWPQLSLH